MAQLMGRAGCVEWRFALVVSFFALAARVVCAAEPLFQHPLHLTRVIEDPISKTSISIDEYCVGNRVVTVRGERVFVVDYERQEITEIDRAVSTYSVTRFDEIARATGRGSDAALSASQATNSTPTASNRGQRRGESGRQLEVFEFADESERVEVAVDRTVSLTRAGFDVLTGAAYPNQPRRNHHVIVGVSRRAAAREVQSNAAAEQATFSLPAEQTTRWQFEGRTVTLRSVVTRVGDEQPPPELLSIPPGARQIESRYSATHRLSDALDGRSPTSLH